MSWRDIKKASRKLGIKGKSAGPWGEGKPEAEDGVCPACRNYDVELDKNGHCRDEKCRRDRLSEALRNGEAVRVGDTTIWTPGTKIRKDF